MLRSDRALQIEVWYPSAAPVADTLRVRYSAKLPRSSKPASSATGAKEFSIAGIAVRDAAPAESKRFPLVLVSHGFGGWGTFLSYLTENLASKGYVVVAIDHADMPFVDGASFGLSFGSVIVHRARDQQFVLQKMVAMSQNADDALGRVIDAKAIGLIGYSMGGFGALTTAGAGYDSTSPTFKQIPSPFTDALMAGNAEFTQSRPANVRAVVLIAPWGGQTANRSWSRDSLKMVKAPTLFVIGDQDDIVDFKDGVSWLFDNLNATDRHMLVYQNARHNIGGNPSPTLVGDDFLAREYFDEPTWRKDRIMAINQHFISAFLDVHLKADMAKKKFVDVSPRKSNDGSWPAVFGQNTGGVFATGSGSTSAYWPGFQRRWALGLEMHSKKAGE